MRASLVVLVLGLVACASPPTHDDAYRRELTVAALATFDAMGLPLERRPSDRSLSDTVGTLALQSSPERVAEIRSGTVTTLDLEREVGDCLKGMRDRGPQYQPPELLVWLRTHVGEATIGQRLLLDALVRQAEREVGVR